MPATGSRSTATRASSDEATSSITGGRTGEFYVHRIVGLPADRLETTEDGGVLLNGARLVEDHLPAGAATELAETVDIPADHYFVLGDNRDRSSDNRVLGPLPRSAIEAPVTEVIPLKTDEDDAC